MFVTKTKTNESFQKWNFYYYNTLGGINTLQGVDTFNKIQKLVHKTNTFFNYDPCLYRKNTKIVKSID